MTKASTKRFFDEATSPIAHSGNGLILKRLSALEAGDQLQPGEASQLLRGCSAAEQRAMVALRGEQASIEDYGRHAGTTTSEALRAAKAHPLVEKFLDAMTTDEITAGVIARRGGSDSQLPIPDLDRRDYIRAALEK